MFGSSEMVIVLVIVLVIFGGSQLPKLARNLGKAQKEFKDGMEQASADDATSNAKSSTETSSNEKSTTVPDDAPKAD